MTHIMPISRKPPILMRVLPGVAAVQGAAAAAAASEASAAEYAAVIQALLTAAFMAPFTFAGDDTPGPIALPLTPVDEGGVIVAVSGVLQRPGTDFTVAGDQLSFTENIPVGLTVHGHVFTLLRGPNE